MKKNKLIHEIRAVKNKKEVENIIKAQRISEKVLRETIKFLKTGVSEKEVENFINKTFIKLKAPILSFPPIVSFGKNTANIHHQPTKTKLKEGDTIMLDFGCTVNHYCSDMTRTFFWKRPNLKQMRIYLGVLGAQRKVIEKMIKGERRSWILDKTARDFLDKKFGKGKFSHGLGHGVGTVIHEWPNLKPKSEDVLPVGCVVTVEPGVYFAGFGGVRIEDMVLIKKDGCINLTEPDKDLEKIILE